MQLTSRKRYPALPFNQWVAYILLIPALAGVAIWAVLPEMVPANGVLEPAEFLILRAPRNGILTHSALEIRQQIRAGELLFQVDDREIATERHSVQKELDNSLVHLNTLKRELARRIDRLSMARTVHQERYRQMIQLVQAGLKTEWDKETLRLNYLKDREMDERQINEIEKEILALEANSAHLRRRSEDLEVQQRQHTRLAPWDGYVIEALAMHPNKPFLGAPARRGDFLDAGRVIGFFGRAQTLALRLSLPDAYRDRIREGQIVSWSPAGYPHSRYREIKGILVKIEPAPEPGFFWGLVQPDPRSLSAFLEDTGLKIEALWGMGVHARLEVPPRPLWDRTGDR